MIFPREKYNFFICRRKVLLLVASLQIFYALYSAGQTTGNQVAGSGIQLPDERVLLVTDRDHYLCGEDIYFTAITYTGQNFKPVSLSKILYLELYSRDFRIISRGKFLISDGRCSGSSPVPRTISTENYYLRAYTRYMEYIGVKQFFLKPLSLINPFYSFTPDSTLIKSKNESDLKADLSSGGLAHYRFTVDRVRLETNGKTFGKRQRVRVSVTAEEQYKKPVKVTLSLFVTISNERNSVDGADSEIYSVPIHEARVFPGKEFPVEFLPETRNDFISGRLLNPGRQPVPGIEILQSFTGDHSDLRSYTTGPDGRFLFMTGNEPGPGDLILKPAIAAAGANVVLDNEFCPDFLQATGVPLRTKDIDIDLLRREFINIQVNDAFMQSEKSSGTIKGNDTSPFYGDFAAVYKFSDYAKLPNMKEFIFEVIQGVVTVRENKTDVINIIDDRNFMKIGSDPLIMIDGVPVTDASIVFALNPEKVRLVRVVRDKYFLHNRIFDGILDIVTYDGDATAFDLPSGTYRYPFMRAVDGNSKKVFSGNTENSKIPIYRNMLFFDPELVTDDKGEAEVSFTTPDNPGTYRIEVFGMTNDGSIIKGVTFIKVGED